jgi:membrane-associated phospholipid phosphatase
MMWDQKISEKIFQTVKQSPALSRLAVFGARRLVWILGGLVLWFIISALSPNPSPFVAMGEGEVFGRWTRLLMIGICILSAWLIQLLIAYTIHRRRPFQQNHEKPLMKLMIPTPSFPSGHTTIACAMAASVFVFNPVVGLVLSVIAALIALCRIAIGVHYVTDVIAGAILGIGVTAVVSFLLLI